tara:strand:- start:1911 stop:2438 length:528 start_codon:yes stop_codon:yes gene_type:complete
MSSFWSDTLLEPKRKYRFKLLMDGQQPYVVTKVKNPAVKISETPHKFLNHTFYYPGRVEWEPIDISFVDPSGPDDQSGRLFDALKDSGYANPTTDQLALEGISKFSATAFGVGKVRIQQLGLSESTVTELVAEAEWELFNVFFTSISWGEYDYNGEEMLECNCTLRYDYAEFRNL